jgi:excinuclease ABC subunit A
MQFMADVQLVCQDCNGARYRPEVLEVKYRDVHIAEVMSYSVERSHTFFRGCGKLQEKLKPLIDIGLGYLPLGQSLSTLSAGELTRLKLASHLESKKSGKQLIVMDEPTAGLHFQDIERLIQCFDVLIDNGNSILIIEHNEQLVRAADFVIELGPGAGVDGGQIITAGCRSDFP